MHFNSFCRINKLYSPTLHSKYPLQKANNLLKQFYKITDRVLIKVRPQPTELGMSSSQYTGGMTAVEAPPTAWLFQKPLSIPSYQWKTNDVAINATNTGSSLNIHRGQLLELLYTCHFHCKLLISCLGQVIFEQFIKNGSQITTQPAFCISFVLNRP